MKIAICTPARDIINASTAFDISRLVGRAAQKHDILLLTAPGTMICNQRAQLVDNAIAEGADWVLFIDSDMRFPPDALDRLLAHRRDIVAANYVTREIPPRPTAFNVSEDGKTWTRVATKLEGSDGLEQVTGVGMGLMLINTRVFSLIPRPWFLIPYSTVNHDYLGEDLYFSLRAHDAELNTYIDHDLSKDVKHVGQFEFGWEHYDVVADGAV